MRLDSPRIAPLGDDELDADQTAALEAFAATGRILNIFRTLAHAPKALLRFQQWGGYVLSKRNALPEREREIVILRTGYLCRSGYEWAQHEQIGLRAGLTPEEIARIKQGPDAEGWSAADAALLRAADELVGDHFISDATWAALDPLSDKAKMDVVFTVGQYTQVSMMLNSLSRRSPMRAARPRPSKPTSPIRAPASGSRRLPSNAGARPTS
ncbi:MAG: carboxymuconolactone decarboxylase family protein [Sphingomonadales bacterium]|nr:carboxymuconolactone decarboxylase family protein [Sphingomonadales bacterium]